MAKLNVDWKVEYKEVVKTECVETTQFELTLTEDEARYLWRLLGNHIVGRGEYRELSCGVWEALDSYFEVGNRCEVLPTVGDSSYIHLKGD